MKGAFLLPLVAAWSDVASASTSLVADPSYVVQIHSTRDAFVPPTDPKEPLRTQFMTTVSGDRFECFLPLSPLQKEAQVAAHAIASDTSEPSEADAFLGFSRAAVKKIRPMCVQYVDTVDRWVYEICPGVLIRKVSLTKRPKGSKNDVASATAQSKAPSKNTPSRDDQSTASETLPQKAPTDKTHEVHELAAFAADDKAQSPLHYKEFTQTEMQTRFMSSQKPLYTQIFHMRGSPDTQVGDIHVQFFCSASARDDVVAAVNWRQVDGKSKEPTAFAIASRLFCNPKHSDPAEKFAVGSLLEPLAELHTCIKRNEGWWTYEFCFGYSIRQYHRENDGTVTAEFSLGVFDGKQNAELEASGASLVTEHIDATHDTARPAFVEMYTGGTHCKEFDVSTPRKSRVYYYCNQNSANHHMVSVKETQTCTYTIKISTPSVCDHPHFITEEPKTDEKAEVVHCIPIATDAEETPEATRAPVVSNEVQEVEVTAT